MSRAFLKEVGPTWVGSELSITDSVQMSGRYYVPTYLVIMKRFRFGGKNRRKIHDLQFLWPSKAHLIVWRSKDIGENKWQSLPPWTSHIFHEMFPQRCGVLFVCLFVCFNCIWCGPIGLVSPWSLACEVSHLAGASGQLELLVLRSVYVTESFLTLLLTSGPLPVAPPSWNNFLTLDF